MSGRAVEAAPPVGEFEELVRVVEPGLRRALVAAYGPELGRDAAADALVWAWRSWPRVVGFANPGGYLYRVGQSSARRALRRQRRDTSGSAEVAWDRGDPAVEPGLERALSGLSARQRAAVVLVHGHHYTLGETALVMGCSPSTVRNHVERALRQLRSALGVGDE